MLQRLKNRKGFTLIELMIVVAILGILAAVAVPVFLKYIRDSKTAEAEENLKSIGDGALTYYQEEHADTTDGMTVETRMYPDITGLCTDGAVVSGNKVAPSGDWTEWKDLRFSISKPHYYKYCFDVGDTGGTRKSFEATADACLDGDSSSCSEAQGGGDSQFKIVGSTDGGGPQVGNIIEVK